MEPTTRRYSGSALLLEHVRTIAGDDDRELRTPPREVLRDRLGPRLAGLLVDALSGTHGMRRRRAPVP